MALQMANVPDRAHSELTFNKLYGDDPGMHDIVSPVEAAEYTAGDPRSFYCFGIPREYPVVRFDLPSKSMLDGSAGKLDALELTGQPGEDLVFQIAVWAPETALGDLRIDTTDFPLPVRIFLQNANERINLLAGTIQVFWCMVHLPERETEFTGKFTVSAENEEPQTVTCHLQVSGAVLSDGGESDDFRLARLKWLESDVGISHEVPEPFVPLRREGRKIFLLGRTLTLSETGLPEHAESFFAGSNEYLGDKAYDLITEPFRFAGNNGAFDKIEKTYCRFTAEYPDRIEWEAGCTFPAINAELKINGAVEYDGFAAFDCEISFRDELETDDIRLEFAAPGKYFAGLNRHGSKVPEKFCWYWDGNRGQDAFFLGDLNGGIRLRLRDKKSITPLTNCYYLFSKLIPPEAWHNAGKGGIRLRRKDENNAVTLFSGIRNIAAGSKLDFGFELQLTPLKLTEPVRHLRQRFYQPYMHDLEKPLEETFTPEFFAQLRSEGVEVINIHHALKENPFINYPFCDISLEHLQKFVDVAHKENLKVCLYYTTRELSLHVPEFWALASLRGKILYPGPGREARPVTAPMGAHPYIQENCRFGYISAWAEAVKEGPCAGQLDLAMETTPGRMLDNYYSEGLRYLLERCPIDGLYLDDTATSREGFRRVIKIFRDIRKCDPILNLHSWNPYNPVRPNYGNISPVIRDMHIYPFISSLWIGESFDYEWGTPEFYLTEISGLPYGLMSEMLYQGGNPWRGMLFAMTGRYGWLADPRPLWKMFEMFGLSDARMVTFCDRDPAVKSSVPSVKATVFIHPDGKVLLAAASWSRKVEKVRFEFDPEQLPENLRHFTGFTAVPVDGLQEKAVYAAGDAIPVAPGKGVWLMLEK